MNAKAKGLFAALSANIVWGFFSIALRDLQNYSVEQILYYRIFVSLIICWLAILFFQKEELKSDLKILRTSKDLPISKLWFLMILSGVLITLNWFAFIYVVNFVNLKTAAFTYMVCPLITALGGFIILKEELTKLKLVAMLIALISIIILATGSLNDVLWSVITASFYASFLIIQRIIKSINKLNMLGFQLILATVFVIPVYLIAPLPIPVDFYFWLDIIIISVAFTLIPLLLSLYAVKSLPSSTVGIIIYVNPIVAFAVAFFYFHETIKLNQLFAYSLLAVAVLVFNWKIIIDSFLRIKNKKQTVDIVS
jgi:chloramphenicol-sensitive protein RarD